MPDRPIRVMRLITRLNVSGPSIHVILLTANLGKPEYESVLVCGPPLSPNDDMSEFARSCSVEPIIVPELDNYINPIRNTKALWKLIRLMREFKPDVVHTHARASGVLGRLAAWLTGVPVIVHTFHEYPFQGYFSPAKSHFFIWLERQMARLSERIITLTENLRRDLVDKYHIASKSKLMVLPMGLDFRGFTGIPRKQGTFRKQWNIPPDILLVGIVGRLIPVKNHALFLTAAQQVIQQIPEVRFVIIGDGSSRPAIETSIQELGLHDSVILTGWYDDMPHAYSDLDLLVNSSRSEGTPVPIIEALASGCPVLATDVGGIADLLEGGQLGKLVPPEDADAFSLAMIKMLENPPEMHAIQEKILDRYNIDRLVSDMDSLYHGLLAHARRS